MIHTPYDRLTDDEFVVLLERAEQTPLVESMIKRLTTDREAALEAAKIEGQEEGEETGERAARCELKERILAAFDD